MYIYIYIYNTVVLVPGDPLRSYRGKPSNMYVCVYIIYIYLTISVRRPFT
jgi:hypothetical protein